MKDYVAKFGDLDFWGKFLFILFIIVIFVGLCFLGFFIDLYFAWALTILWKWFIVPLGLGELPLKTAFGAIIIVGLFKGLRAVSNKDVDINWKQTIWGLLSAPIFMLLLGYVVLLVL